MSLEDYITKKQFHTYYLVKDQEQKLKRYQFNKDNRAVWAILEGGAIFFGGGMAALGFGSESFDNNQYLQYITAFSGLIALVNAGFLSNNLQKISRISEEMETLEREVKRLRTLPDYQSLLE